MKTSLGGLGLLLLAAALLAGLLLPGCGGSENNPDDQLNGNFTGIYSHPFVVVTMTTNNATVTTNSATVTGLLVTTNSGAPVTLLNLTQSQGSLHAGDNRGDVFTGTFSIVYANGGMVQMEGLTGAGIPVQIAGYLETSGSNAWIDASWIEPDLTGALYGTAPVTPFSPTNPAVWKP